VRPAIWGSVEIEARLPHSWRPDPGSGRTYPRQQGWIPERAPDFHQAVDDALGRFRRASWRARASRLKVARTAV